MFVTPATASKRKSEVLVVTGTEHSTKRSASFCGLRSINFRQNFRCRSSFPPRAYSCTLLRTRLVHCYPSITPGFNSMPTNTHHNARSELLVGVVSRKFVSIYYAYLCEDIDTFTRNIPAGQSNSSKSSSRKRVTRKRANRSTVEADQNVCPRLRKSAASTNMQLTIDHSEFR